MKTRSSQSVLLLSTAIAAVAGCMGDAPFEAQGSAALTEVKPSAVSASSNEAGNPPGNATDGDLSTRWAAFGQGELLELDFGSAKSFGGLSVAWFQGDQRRYTYQVQVAGADRAFTDVGGRRTSAGTTAGLENVSFTATGRYLRILGFGNTQSGDWVSLFEVKAFLASTSGPDTSAPALSNGQPSGTLAAGTTSTTLRVTTDEAATCRWSNSGSDAYASMPSTFSTTGGTSHSTGWSGLANGQSFTRFVRCIDAAGNANSSSLKVSFSVAATGTTTGRTGLDFPGSAGTTTTMRFRFSSPHTNGLPIWGPDGRGVTYVWQAFPRQQPGYYTTFFWGNDGDFFWGDFTYYGFHPYPQGDGAVHKWEIAADRGGDFLDADVAYNRWYTQVARVWADANGKHHELYWDWPNTSRVFTHTADPSYGNGNPPVPALTFGDAPWPSSFGSFGPSGQGHEVYNGILRGFQIYNNLLSIGDIQKEIDAPLSTAAGANSIWYLNVNPTPGDISDKSGRGHNPAWVGSERPKLSSQ